ncbi:MAG: NAD-dependent epimerase/dehydratase family protein [Paracoccaceae bacterium]
MIKNGPILVTGAGGFVCSEIALALARTGADVVAVDQHFDTETTRRFADVRRIEGGLLQVLDGELGRISAVVHGAAITASPERLGISRAAHIRRNMDMLTATLEGAKEAGAQQFLFLSSMGVFEPSDQPHDGRFTEATQPTADCTYCAAKHAGELLTASAADGGFTTLSLRLGNIFGPHEAIRETRQHLCLVARMIAEARETHVITVHTPEAQREWSWLPDLANAVVRLMDEGLPRDGLRIWHAGSPPVIGDLAVARLIADRMPGTTIRLAARPHADIRPPMASDVASVFSGVEWTGMTVALDQLLRVKVTT